MHHELGNCRGTAERIQIATYTGIPDETNHSLIRVTLVETKNRNIILHLTERVCRLEVTEEDRSRCRRCRVRQLLHGHSRTTQKRIHAVNAGSVDVQDRTVVAVHDAE